MRWYISDWALIGMYRRVLKLLVRKEPVLTGTCKCCGCCCKEIVLHLEGKWQSSERRFRKLVAENPELERFKIVGKDPDGRLIFSCKLQRSDGLCGDYENRLDLCRMHPTVGLYYSGVRLAPYCGFRIEAPTIRGRIRQLLGVAPPDFKAILERERQDSMVKGNDNS